MRTLRRYIARYRNEGIKGLLDRRMWRVSPMRAPKREISEVVALYRNLYPDRSVAHFYDAHTQKHWGPLLLSRENKKLMRLIDEIYLEYQFKGSRRLRDVLLARHGVCVNRKRVTRLMRLLGLAGAQDHPQGEGTLDFQISCPC